VVRLHAPLWVSDPRMGFALDGQYFLLV